MRKLMRNASLLLTALSMSFFTACSDDDDNGNGGNGGGGSETIATVAANNEGFSILVEALVATGLDGNVDDENASLTVFAPTNAAFEALFTELGVSTVAELEASIGTDALRNILLYHVLPTAVSAGDAATGYVETMAENAREHNLSMYISAATSITINGESNVTDEDIQASNGYIHAIDAVIMPPSILGLVSPNAEFSSLVAAVAASDNDPQDVLDDDGQTYTLFAPTNEAFDELVSDLEVPDLAAVVNVVGSDGLFVVLAYHLLSGDVRAETITAGSQTTIAQQDFDISVDGSGSVTITDTEGRTAMVTSTNITATNGSIHIINNVLLPDLD